MKSPWLHRLQVTMAIQCDSHEITMAIPLPRCIGEDDLHAAVGGVVCPLPFLSIAVPNIVGILLLKLESRVVDTRHEK